MDGSRFDDLTRLLARPRSRRGALRLIAASVGAALTGRATADAAPKAPKCYGEGSQCTNAKQCCSGLCVNRRCAPSFIPECTVASDCPTPANECAVTTCTGGICGSSNLPYGTPTGFQTSGDCQKTVCNGAGAIISIADDTDLPTDNNGCTTDTCVNGVPMYTPKPAGTTCGDNGGTVCNGAGNCVGCLSASDCPGQDTECATRTCISGICGMSFAPAGNPVSTQTAGDCQLNVCDGNGNQTSQPDDTDLPVDGNTCTTDTCTNGVPSHAPLPAGTTCPGGTCNQAGNCVPAACTPGATQSCYSGPAGTAGVGVCRAGVQTCLPDGNAFGPCVGEVTPSLELCDGIDNDCDGRIDNGFAVGTPCTNGQLGACFREGILVCSPDGTGVVCSAPQVQPQQEICNGIDDDCDGLVDEGAICPPVTNGTTACVSGACVMVGCNPGFANCNGNPADGCETNVFSSVTNCGGCGIVCPDPENGSAICAVGQCRIQCDGGYTQCGNTCKDLDGDRLNCGACGHICAANQFCDAGTCVLISQPGG